MDSPHGFSHCPACGSEEEFTTHLCTRCKIPVWAFSRRDGSEFLMVHPNVSPKELAHARELVLGKEPTLELREQA
jgi:hypothetical protein